MVLAERRACWEKHLKCNKHNSSTWRGNNFYACMIFPFPFFFLGYYLFLEAQSFFSSYALLLLLETDIVHRIVLLARDWSERLTWLNITWEYPSDTRPDKCPCMFPLQLEAIVYILSHQKEGYYDLVYTTQVSAFRARWLASLEVISQILFTSEKPIRKTKWLPVSNKVTLWSASYSACVVYKYPPLFTSTSVNNC